MPKAKVAVAPSLGNEIFPDDIQFKTFGSWSAQESGDSTNKRINFPTRGKEYIVKTFVAGVPSYSSHVAVDADVQPNLTRNNTDGGWPAFYVYEKGN